MLGEHLSSESDLLADSAEAQLASDSRRWSSRIRQTIPVKVWPANPSERLGSQEIAGSSRDVSETGCGIVSHWAPIVGDFYFLQFENDQTVEVGNVYARCVRCHLIDENSYESGFAFQQPIELEPEHNAEDDDQLV